MTVPFDIPNALADGAGGTDPHNGGVFCDSLSERRVTMVCRIGIFARAFGLLSDAPDR